MAEIDVRSRMRSVGVPGNTGRYGYATTGEYVAKLDGAPGRAIYETMRRSDYQVGAVLSAITLPIRQADYFVEPGSDKSKDKKIAKILEDALLHGMTQPWDDTVRHALLMLPFGFSPLEKVYEYRDGLVLPRKLDPRLPTSVIRWDMNAAKTSLEYMVQRDTDGQEIKIPIEKLLVFTCQKEGDNWEGISLLRTAYKAWYIKDKLEKINAIQHERYGVGIPHTKVPKNVARGSDEWNAVVESLQDIHANEKSYFAEPDGYETDILTPKGTAPDTLAVIRHYDEAIAKAMLAMHINLGSTKAGAKNLGESFINAFLMANQSVADYIAEVINRFCVRELVDLNWSVKEYPTFRCKRIHGLDLQAIGYLMQAGVITHDGELENDVRTVLRVPPKPKDAKPARPAPPRPPVQPELPLEEPEESDEDEPPEEGDSE